MNETISLQINKCKTFIDFMLSQQQWSGLQKSDVESWLKNFKDVQSGERLLVYKLLSNIIYFSEADVIAALKEGIYKCLYYSVILEKQINAKFSMSQQALAAVCQEELENTYFIPLLDSNSPHESGNYIMRLLVQQNIIQPRQSVFLESLPDIFISRKIKRLVVVDDCVGSGHQLLDFWTNATVDINDNVITLAELCEKYGVEANYLTLFGYDKSIDMLQGSLRNLRIYCVRKLTDTQRVFQNGAYIWKDNDECEAAKDLFEGLCADAGIPLYGYNGLDFAFIMHRTIPDWTLPLFWKENADWNLLMRRKNSND